MKGSLKAICPVEPQKASLVFSSPSPPNKSNQLYRLVKRKISYWDRSKLMDQLIGTKSKRSLGSFPTQSSSNAAVKSGYRNAHTHIYILSITYH